MFDKLIKEEQIEFLQVLSHVKEIHPELNTSAIIESIVEYIALSLIYNPPKEILCSVIRFLSFHLKKTEKIGKETSLQARIRVQDEFRELGIVNIVLSLMCDKKLDQEIFSALIIFSNGLLEGGNEKIQ